MLTSATSPEIRTKPLKNRPIPGKVRAGVAERRQDVLRFVVAARLALGGALRRVVQIAVERQHVEDIDVGAVRPDQRQRAVGVARHDHAVVDRDEEAELAAAADRSAR